MNTGPRITYIGGPTAMIEIFGLRFLTDPTFDPPGNDYKNGPVTLSKVEGPAISQNSLGHIDAVLLSHDHHADNLDSAGRAFLKTVPAVYTTIAAAERLQGGAVGLAPWQSIDIPTTDGVVRVTGTPARHGPSHSDRGPVTGFVVSSGDSFSDSLYISGDTVWYEGIADVARRYPVAVAVLFLGAAQVEQVGPWPLTMTAPDAIHAAKAFSSATIVPLHYSGWKHLRESRKDVETAFAAAGLSHRLQWLSPGLPIPIPPSRKV
jgi:L-ascorbate metabolism protein UlaG (beta-lactamase superfamily)